MGSLGSDRWPLWATEMLGSVGTVEPEARGGVAFPHTRPGDGSLCFQNGWTPARPFCELPDPCVFLMQIYVHLKEGGGPDGLDALKNKPQLHSMVARSLCRTAAGRNYIIFTGPSITSLTLFEEFEKQGLASGERVRAQSPAPEKWWARLGMQACGGQHRAQDAGREALPRGDRSCQPAGCLHPAGHWRSGGRPDSWSGGQVSSGLPGTSLCVLCGKAMAIRGVFLVF